MANRSPPTNKLHRANRLHTKDKQTVCWFFATHVSNRPPASLPSLDDEEIVTHARPGSNRTVRQSRWCPRRDELKNKTWLILTHLPRHLWRKYRREGWRFDTCFAKRIIGTECCTRMDRFWTWFYRKSKKVSAWKKSINKSWIFNWSRFKAILRVVYISTTLIKLFNCYSIESNIFSQPTIDSIRHQSRCNP